MTSPMIKRDHFRPHYDEAKLDKRADKHLFIAEEAALPVLQTLLESTHHDRKKSLVVADLDISPVDTAAYQLVPRARMTTYIDAFLLAHTQNAAVYLAGTESFMWQVHKRVLNAGVAKSQDSFVGPHL